MTRPRAPVSKGPAWPTLVLTRRQRAEGAGGSCPAPGHLGQCRAPACHLQALTRALETHSRRHWAPKFKGPERGCHRRPPTLRGPEGGRQKGLLFQVPCPPAPPPAAKLLRTWLPGCQAHVALLSVSQTKPFHLSLPAESLVPPSGEGWQLRPERDPGLTPSSESSRVRLWGSWERLISEVTQTESVCSSPVEPSPRSQRSQSFQTPPGSARPTPVLALTCLSHTTPRPRLPFAIIPAGMT